jgi:hypothetical protein
VRCCSQHKLFVNSRRWVVANFVILFTDGFYVVVSIDYEREWLFLHTAFWDFRNFRLRRKRRAGSNAVL